MWYWILGGFVAAMGLAVIAIRFFVQPSEYGTDYDYNADSDKWDDQWNGEVR
jgi:hypothetical protein